jgi:hypothetical protein
MKPVVVISLKNSFGQMAAYALIANVHIHIDSGVLQVALVCMNALNVNGSLLLPPERQCTARNCHSGNGFWQFITYSIQVRAFRRFS